MKRELFDIYDKNIQELEARVINIEQIGNQILVILDRTPFRTSSGGQPSDNGYLENDKFKGSVSEVIEKDNELLHKVDVESGKLNIGDKVIARINTKRRKILTLMHSGEHLFSGSLRKVLDKDESLTIEKIMLNERESSVFLRINNLNWNLLFKAEALTNRIIKEGKKVIIHYTTKNKLDKFISKGLRIKKERLKDNFVRIIEFEDFDFSACSGTHVKNASEIIAFLITDFKKLGKNRFEVKFKTGEDVRGELYEESRVLRRIKSLLGKDNEESFDVIKKQINEMNLLKDRYQKYLSEFILKLKPEKMDNIDVYEFIFDDEDSRVLVKAGSRLCKSHKNEKDSNAKKRMVLFFNRKDDKTAIIFMSSNLNIDLMKFFNDKIKKSYKVKGGGSKNLLIGSLLYSREEADKVINEISRLANRLIKNND